MHVPSETPNANTDINSNTNTHTHTTLDYIRIWYEQANMHDARTHVNV